MQLYYMNIQALSPNYSTRRVIRSCAIACNYADDDNCALLASVPLLACTTYGVLLSTHNSVVASHRRRGNAPNYSTRRVIRSCAIACNYADDDNCALLASVPLLTCTTNGVLLSTHNSVVVSHRRRGNAVTLNAKCDRK